MFLAPLIILPFADAAVWAYGELRAESERKGTPIGALDTMIADQPSASRHSNP
jgi:tRNA(fMet)-specific endonuclease VapC